MAETFEGSVHINRTGTSNSTIVLYADTGNITAGGSTQDGDVLLKDGTDANRIHLDSSNNTIIFYNASNQVIAELGRNGNLRLGGGGLDGDIEMYKSDNQRTLHFDADKSNLWIGGNGTDGDIVLFPSGTTNSNDASQGTIHLDADAGDIILRNADCAEDFTVAAEHEIEPGMVLTIDDEGSLAVSRQAYDRRVAGVASGAGAYRPGMVLDRVPGQLNRQPVALVGKVYCKVDANYGAIQVGDLLTTSPTAGHAMRAADPLRAFGAVVGKALRPFAEGQGLIPILVALQ